jgi:hypothetical protein
MNDPLAGLDLRYHPHNYAMRNKSQLYPKAWEGKVPKTVRIKKTVYSDIPLFLPGGDFVCEKDRFYQVISNRHGAVSAWVGPGDNDFLGLKPNEFEIVEFWEKQE